MANPASLQNLYGTPHAQEHVHGNKGSSGASTTAEGSVNSNLPSGIPVPRTGAVLNEVFSSSNLPNAGSDTIRPEFDTSEERNFEESKAGIDRLPQFVSGSNILGGNPNIASESDFSVKNGNLENSGRGPNNLVFDPSSDRSVLLNNQVHSGEITITREATIDVFTTVTNIFYNSVPVTLSEFIKTTVTQPTLLVSSHICS